MVIELMALFDTMTEFAKLLSETNVAVLIFWMTKNWQELLLMHTLLIVHYYWKPSYHMEPCMKQTEEGVLL